MTTKFLQGCVTALFDWFDDKMLLFVGTVSTVLIFQVTCRPKRNFSEIGVKSIMDKNEFNVESKWNRFKWQSGAAGEMTAFYIHWSAYPQVSKLWNLFDRFFYCFQFRWFSDSKRVRDVSVETVYSARLLSQISRQCFRIYLTITSLLTDT